ncbi:hypothetical protein EVJ58_g9716 [Rhodofomes roseus]|uniref:Uncharacterized protein n=1 Tax=Rhodofomes roseus TaxID=34475 RepID=A0A4Y9XUY3_9APHY|nr:hypothetical protein EVJ58_g9716 [Rhodofomes roseus]
MSFIHIPAFCDDNDNPYEFEVDDEEVLDFSKRIANIANKFWGDLEREGRRASLDS